jgi:hypothetical protein
MAKQNNLTCGHLTEQATTIISSWVERWQNPVDEAERQAACRAKEARTPPTLRQETPPTLRQETPMRQELTWSQEPPVIPKGPTSLANCPLNKCRALLEQLLVPSGRPSSKNSKRAVRRRVIRKDPTSPGYAMKVADLLACVIEVVNSCNKLALSPLTLHDILIHHPDGASLLASAQASQMSEVLAQGSIDLVVAAGGAFASDVIGIVGSPNAKGVIKPSQIKALTGYSKTHVYRSIKNATDRATPPKVAGPTSSTQPALLPVKAGASPFNSLSRVAPTAKEGSSKSKEKVWYPFGSLLLSAVWYPFALNLCDARDRRLPDSG